MFGRLPWLAFDRRRRAFFFLVFLDMRDQPTGSPSRSPRCGRSELLRRLDAIEHLFVHSRHGGTVDNARSGGAGTVDGDGTAVSRQRDTAAQEPRRALAGLEGGRGPARPAGARMGGGAIDPERAQPRARAVTGSGP